MKEKEVSSAERPKSPETDNWWPWWSEDPIHLQRFFGPGEALPEVMPEGWSSDPKLLKQFINPHNGEWDLAQACGLDNPQIIMRMTPETGEMIYLFKSGDCYYMGDLLADYLRQITRPLTLPEIVRTMVASGERGLKLKRVKITGIYEG
ncbi:hypothetical protein BO99DRAFT_398778 [Aspergillus violaceofuscus CBS 115571]|uniref:Knr4/Smi1-like domain-containing protein n=1 Tax=Aspergillus violaceofuscus (strain CBS 115571) TaxID=1450538 RepID=A0A2V5I5E1_ASPV1|nr:hypothetical protein BO99DRAFT_398778 [Aspergillus violaceofuscus CBS 115571]